jgi:hypothetical protein
MAFSADELRVLRRALAQVLNPPSLNPPSPALTPAHAASPALVPARAPHPLGWASDVQDVLRLTESIDEAVHEAGRMRAFALADLARYRQALPGSATGYLERLDEAVADGYLPEADDLAALRSLTAQPCAPAERTRRLALRARCGELAEAAVRRRLESATRPPQLVGGTVTEFARPARTPRPRGGTGGRTPEIRNSPGGAPLSLPNRRGGPFPMASSDTPTPSSKADPTDTDETDVEQQEEEGQQTRPAVRPVPTPADLFPRGVRKPQAPVPGGGSQLATGTG